MIFMYRRAAVRVLKTFIFMSVIALVFYFFAIAVFAFFATREDMREPYVTSKEISPDKRYKAVLSGMAGGALSPYCIEHIAIVSNDAPPEMEIAEDMIVFTSDCTEFSFKSRLKEQSPSYYWVDNEKLKIRYSIYQNSSYPDRMTLKAKDASGKIAVEYEAIP